MRRRAEHDRNHQALGGLALEIARHGLEVGLLVVEQLLEQVVVVIGELLEHMEPRRLLAVEQLVGDRHLFGRLAVAELERAVERQVDEADRFLALADRDLPVDHRRDAERLQGLEQLVDAAAGLVDLVDEDDVRNAAVLELAQHRLGQRGALGLGRDHHQREVGDVERAVAVRGEADRAWAIEQHVLVAGVAEAGQVEFGGAASRAGFRARVALRGAGVDRAEAGNRSRGVQQGLCHAGLASARGPYQRDGSRTAADGIHVPLLGCSRPEGPRRSLPAG